MSGIKRKIEDGDPDYEDVALVQNSKRNKAAELSARDATVQKIEAIITEQFSLEMKNKEHEIDIISQRLNEARRMMDKLRACIVANFYATAGMTKLQESSKSDPAALNHPAIRRFLEFPSRSSSPLNQGSETPSLAQSESESLSQHGDTTDKDIEGVWREDSDRLERRPGRNTGKDTFGVSTMLGNEQRVTCHTSGDESSRLYAKKTIVVGNVSKYIPPDKREENDQSTHKWMVYVRGSRKEPSIDHFVKKVWFFLHPSYKPNDLVEVSEPPFHLTRRGWGEFPVRIQIHFKDHRNKRVDIIHQLKLDRTYTGLQTLGAETVVDVELQRNSLGEEYILKPSSSKVAHRASSPMTVTSTAQPCGQSSSPISYESSFDKGSIKAEAGRSTGAHRSVLTASERTPTRPKASDRITLGCHGNSAFQPITASCKIVPQGQPPSPAESPGKTFKPITMSCKIVSGSPISTPSHSPLPRTPTSSTPVPSKQSSSSVLNNPYVIMDKPGQVTGAASSSAASAGSPSAKQSAAQGTRSPAPKIHTGTLLSSGMKVIIKQEPGEVSTHQQQQQQMASTVSTQQQAAATASHQLVSVKGGHMISMSAQKQAGAASGAATNKMLGIPVSSTLQSAVKQVAISSGQILVAKGSPSVSKVVGGKQVLAQGVAKAIVSGTTGISGQQATAKPGSSGKTGVMATLQLPANNLANLANLPPGTKLYLTTNSKNPSGKGKLLLIPQGAILRASNAGQQSQSSSSAGAPTSSASSSSSLPSNLSYTSYILKQTPQGTFLVGQPSQGSGKQGNSGVAAHATSSPSTAPQQAIRVTAGQKAAILAQMVGSSQGAQVKLSDGSVKTVTAAGHLSKSGMTTLRMTGGVITATSAAPSSVSTATTGNQQQQASDGGKSASQYHSLLMAANQAAVISAAKSASAAGGGSLTKTAMATLVKGAANSAAMAKSAAGAKGVAGMPVVGTAKGASVAPKSGSTSLVTAASLVSGTTTPAGGGKSASTVSGMLKIHSGGSNSQQTVLTIPANQLKQLAVSSGSGAMQTILMPLGKVKTEPGAGTAVTAGPSPPATASIPTSVHVPSTTVKQEQGADHLMHDLISTEYIETMMQLLTAVVKKFPLIVPDKSEDSHPFCASSTEQYYSWNIGKRRASELQRAVAVKRAIQNVLDHSPRLQALTPPKTREVVQWCRQRGYTPPDPEPQHRNDDESIEDVLTQIDSEPECPTTLSSSDELLLRLEQMQALLKTEPEDADDEIVDIVTVTPPPKVKVKEEEQEADTEPKFLVGPCLAAQFVNEAAQQIGITFQPVEVEKSIFAPVIEDMIVKATEQLASDILREALAGAFAKSPHNRAPREITAMNIHQAICSIPTCDFLTNAHMGYLPKDN
ncbi:YEATS domain-containing protein 2 isoform X1 [Syngnathus acus]|uniref:YEATS domain-containing protein 2 isoform X1 n=1 Tax=Syngnathus acus TaxID=161584 RepID=UPI0018861F54|nr:YEATS domain-containing protein 2 isoform X1 [Syngnathus acus]XP_037132092.1 YEATS domain-containing protein 2 isoform X1 [Syngnathus acus]